MGKLKVLLRSCIFFILHKSKRSINQQHNYDEIMTKRKIFKDDELQAHFEKNGYVKMQFLQPQQVSELLQFLQNNNIHFKDGFDTTFTSPDALLKKSIYDFVLQHIPLNDYFVDYKPLVCAFLCKKSHTNQSLDLHQDWCFIDETTGLRSINVWCPLIDTNHTNGSLSLIVGSHKLPRYNRANPTTLGVDKNLLELNKQNTIEINTQCGEAIVYDNATYHGSSANTSNEDRIVIGILLIPKESDGILYYTNNTNGFDMYLSGVDYYIEKNPFIQNSGIYLGSVDNKITVDYINECFKIQYNLKYQNPFAKLYNWFQRLFLK